MRFTVDERRWLPMLLLGMVWAAGVGCSRWRKDDVGTWKLCCEGVDSCLELLQITRKNAWGSFYALQRQQQSQEGVPADRLALDGPKGRVPIRAATGPAPRCPEVTPRGKDWKLQGQTEALILQPVRDESSLELRGPCAGLRDAEYASIAAPLGEACLVGRDDGEFGGWLRVYEKASTTRLTGANPRRFLEVYGQAVVLSGLAHLGGSEGLLFRGKAWGTSTWCA